MRKLFAVRIELEIEEPVVAESAKEAEEIAKDHLDEILGNLFGDESYSFFASEVDKLPADFEGAYAYSSDRHTDILCDDIFREQKEAEEAEMEKERLKKLRIEMDKKQLKLNL